ncbi:MAG: hypothetical protein AB7T48_04105 [Solirubrobacterales bacterium]
MAAGGEERICAVNLLPLKQGATIGEFEQFLNELDRPTCLAQDVVEGFDAYAVRRRGPGAPAFDIVEVMTVRSWSEWERVRDGNDAFAPVIERWGQLVDGDGARTLFATPIAADR